MGLENQSTNDVYIQLLADVLKKKIKILAELTELTLRQEEIISSEAFNEEQFLQTISMKDQALSVLNELDNGFELIYERVREALISNKRDYSNQIKHIQQMISAITDSSVNLQALERRNKAKLEVYFSTRRKQIKTSRANNQSVTNYYKTMTKQNEMNSFFYDKKK